jgi:hypothetical protein
MNYELLDIFFSKPIVGISKQKKRTNCPVFSQEDSKSIEKMLKQSCLPARQVQQDAVILT